MKRPASNKRLPLNPRKLTPERSGSLSAASPPPLSRVSAIIAGALSARARIAINKVNSLRRDTSANFDIEFTIKKIPSFIAEIKASRKESVIIADLLLQCPPAKKGYQH